MQKPRSKEMIDFTLLMGERLTALRKAHGKTQNELAVLLGLDRTSLTYFEKGSHAMSLYYLTILAKYYKVSLDLIVGDQKKFDQYIDQIEEHKREQGEK